MGQVSGVPRRQNEKANRKYNILPLKVPGQRSPLLEIPEIKEAMALLCSVEGLPMIKAEDLLDWLRQSFGFQKDNAENQKEHLLLLIANVSMSKRGNAVRYLKGKIFENYNKWCAYLHMQSNIKIQGEQKELLYICLYLLIWGEASNIRFMPECICYIFHHMANDLNVMLTQEQYEPRFKMEGIDADDTFLHHIVQPIYNLIEKESKRSKQGTVSHSQWRNYEDLNEYFWLEESFKELGWPMDLTAKFFRSHTKPEKWWKWSRKRMSKINFVEIRTFLHLFRSFDRMWIFFILTFQALVLVAWSTPGSLYGIVEPNVFRNLMTVFITAAGLNLVQALLEVVLSWEAWRSFKSSERIRYILKIAVATSWLTILPITYSNFQSKSIYYIAVTIYMIPGVVNTVLLFPPIQVALKNSSSSIIRLIWWWMVPKSYAAQGLYEDLFSRLKYTLFWIILLTCKLIFSFYVEVSPLIVPTKAIIILGLGNEWEEFLPNTQHESYVIIIMWAPIVLIYFVDTLIWYSIFSTICGGISGILSHVGEIRTVGMLRSRFESIPMAFVKRFVPAQDNQFKGQVDKHLVKFADIWNAFINSLREEDLLSNREKNLLVVPSSGGNTSLFQWPPFLLASKIQIAIHMAKSVNKEHRELIEMMKKDVYTYYAIKECYETSFKVLAELAAEPYDRILVDHVRENLEVSIKQQSFLKEFQLDGLPLLCTKFDKLLNILTIGFDDNDMVKTQIGYLLQDIMRFITHFVMTNGKGLWQDGGGKYQLFTNLNLDPFKNKDWREKCIRLQLLLTTNDPALNVPRNIEAQRRITFFANSLFMKMPRAPSVRNMMSFSVLTPYYKEEVLFSQKDLCTENDEGVSLLFYLQKNYPDEWKNFIERIDFEPKDEEALEDRMDEISCWASLRGQTLTRTVRGVMYYKKALEIQCMQDKDDLGSYDESEAAIADIKFTYVVACQSYGMQRKSKDAKFLSILNLMKRNPSLRVAFIDEVETTFANGTTGKTYYSVLVKGGTSENIYNDEEIYRIKLPGKPTNIGEGKPENQNHAIVFTRGEALQAIDMNQDSYLEEAFKIRNVLEELKSRKYGRKPTILGLREHIYTGSVSSVAWFMFNQETCFVTLGQRVLANPLRVRFHYGHPDIFDRLFHITIGGISKGSKTINLSEDIFSGFNSTMRGGNVTHHEYMQVGKGRDVGLNQISSFEAKVASGNGEQMLSREVYRLGQGLDFFRVFSFYFTTVGQYFCNLVTIVTVYLFLYGRLYLVLSGLDKAIRQDPRFQWNIKPLLEKALAAQSAIQFGFVLVLPMLMEMGLEKGFRVALVEFIMMQIQLAPIFFTFNLGTKIHYYGRTIVHGGAKYRATGRGFTISHVKFAENYRCFSRSHFLKGFELMILLVLDRSYGSSFMDSRLFLFVYFSMWFLVFSWLFAPFIFNPSGFEWQKAVDDWGDWWNWMNNRGGIGMTVEQSWEAWWISEQAHLRQTGLRALLLEILLSSRMLIFQYGIIYHLNITDHSRSFQVYLLSWLVMITAMAVLKMVSFGRKRFGTNHQILFRFLKALVLFGLIGLLWYLFLYGNLTIPDIIATILAFGTTGWWVLLIAQACSRFLMRTMLWDSIVELGWAYDMLMGMLLFLPCSCLSWFPSVSEFQARLLFNQAFCRGLHITRLFAGYNDEKLE